MGANGKTEANGKFRFSLQFGADTPERAQVGEFLKDLGNRKSGVIVAAVAAYLQERPEIFTSGLRPQIVLQTGLSYERLKEMIRAVVEEKLAGAAGMPQSALPPVMSSIENAGDNGNNGDLSIVDGGNPAPTVTSEIESGVAAMLANVDLFS